MGVGRPGLQGQEERPRDLFTAEIPEGLDPGTHEELVGLLADTSAPVRR